MKKFFLLNLLTLTFISFASSQTKYIVVDFSDNYTLEYVFENVSEGASPEYFILKDPVTKKILLEYGNATLKKFAHDPTSKTTTIGKSEIPESNIWIVNDYNFDGINDILICDPELIDDGCYNPKKEENIFLSKKDSTFRKNKSLSKLFNETHCLRGGIIYVDTTNHLICTQVTGGAALHYQYSYQLENDTLKLVKQESEDGFFNHLYGKTEIKELVKGKWQTSTSYYFLREMPEPLISFETLNKKGTVLLFQKSFYIEGTNSNNLYYAFMTDDGMVTFAYPNDPEKTTKNTFTFDSNFSELTFNSGDIKYTIYENSNGCGIKININGKMYDWQGNKSKKTGSLSNLKTLHLNNVSRPSYY